MTRLPTRPQPVAPRDAGGGGQGGWLAPDGRFYPAPRLHHLRVAWELRATGDGPGDPWDMRDGWIMIRDHGEVVALPDRATQAQWNALGDLLIASPSDSGYRSTMLASLRALREMGDER